MCGDKCEDTVVVVVVVVVAHPSTAERALPALLWWQPHLPRVRARQGWVVIDVERLEEEVVSLCGEGGVCEAKETGFLLAGLRINFNQGAPLAGYTTP